MFNLFKRTKTTDPRTEWNERGSRFAAEVNHMVSFAEKNGWESWTGKEPSDDRDHLADHVVRQLKEANATGKVAEFRTDYPPAHTPLIAHFRAKGQNIGPIHYIDQERVVFIIGAYYEERRAYMLHGATVTELGRHIETIGKSRRGDVFAILEQGVVTTTNGWAGPVIRRFHLRSTKDFAVEELIPFNDGTQVILVTSEGIYLVGEEQEILLHPVPDPADEEGGTNIDMANATLSHDNRFIVVGDQCSEHRVLDRTGKEIGSIGQRSEYPHFCLFSQNDGQLITNSCHFYSGATIGVDAARLDGIRIPAYEEDTAATLIDDAMRVYVGVAVDDHYILGDANGYIRAIDTQGKCLWRHFLGSTVSGMAISADGLTLWVGCCTGMIHKLKLGAGHRDDHTIGNGNHYEEFRLVFWKGEPVMRW